MSILEEGLPPSLPLTALAKGVRKRALERSHEEPVKHAEPSSSENVRVPPRLGLVSSKSISCAPQARVPSIGPPAKPSGAAAHGAYRTVR